MHVGCPLAATITCKKLCSNSDRDQACLQLADIGMASADVFHLQMLQLAVDVEAVT
jgi:hypothetical protein